MKRKDIEKGLEFIKWLYIEKDTEVNWVRTWGLSLETIKRIGPTMGSATKTSCSWNEAIDIITEL